MNYNQSLILHIQGINPLSRYEDSRVDIIFDDGKYSQSETISPRVKELAYQSYRTEYKEGNFLLTPTEDIVDLSNLKAFPKNEFYLIRIWLPNLDIIPYKPNWYALYEDKSFIKKETFDTVDFIGEDYIEIYSPPYQLSI